MVQRYAVINNAHVINSYGYYQCVNNIMWDGVAAWQPPNNCVAVQSNIIQIGDQVQQVDGVWVVV